MLTIPLLLFPLIFTTPVLGHNASAKQHLARTPGDVFFSVVPEATWDILPFSKREDSNGVRVQTWLDLDGPLFGCQAAIPAGFLVGGWNERYLPGCRELERRQGKRPLGTKHRTLRLCKINRSTSPILSFYTHYINTWFLRDHVFIIHENRSTFQYQYQK